ncbi:LysR family transcriptional regulator [Bailinhaonella thermotolerans]|uniref:LysR family transcriptional regulator n=1 Tax=Bailinhaonella thermotolerans TaxID=1070861 RepID=A0A3A4AET8_9ACTN|nr:LysR family transcriptional regulator [Bailinhaonella thermotolerans]RJL27165.1 LysR family transcriptional regulator [Bailinhaonella thermotolerans]
MTLDDLRVFVAVCEAGSLSAVARTLSCTQSAVSQHVKRLERETGLALVERHARGVSPTAAGRVLYEAALGGIAALDTALRRLGDLREGRGGTVRITTGGVTVRHFMAEAIPEFRRRHPDVSLEFRSAHSARRCVEQLLDGRADLAWITLGEEVPGVEQRPVFDLPWVLVVRADDPLARRTSIGPETLAEIRYIAHPENSASRRRLEEDFIRLGVRPPEPVGVADWDTAVLLAELGAGHAVLPALPRLDLSAASAPVAVPIPALTPLPVGWAVRRWSALSPAAAEFAALVT